MALVLTVIHFQYTLSTLAILPPPPSLPHPAFAGSACQAHHQTRTRVTSFRKHALVVTEDWSIQLQKFIGCCG